jgi:thymidylate kinase
MKVAFIGTHGVGKTTLCYELAARLKKRSVDADIVKEVARSSPLPINQRTTVAAQLWILHMQIAREIEVESRCEVVICDRSVLDNYAYLLHASGRQAGAEHLVEDWIATYDLLFRVPPAGRISKDGIRDTDPLFQRAIDRRIRRLVQEMRVEVQDLSALPRARWITSATQAVLARIEGPEESSRAAAKPKTQLDLFL